ncbi:hypothetical protein ACFSDD_24610, partial [Salipiger marinus]
ARRLVQRSGPKVWVDGELGRQPPHHVSDFNADLPEVEKSPLHPGTKHGTREVFEEKVLAAGCERNRRDGKP